MGQPQRWRPGPLSHLRMAPLPGLLGEVAGQILVCVIPVKGQPPQLQVVPVDPQPPDLLQVIPCGVEHHMVVEAPSRIAPLRHIDVVKQMSPLFPRFAQPAQEGPDPPDRRIAAVRQVLVIIGEGEEQVPVIEVGRQGPFQLLERSPGVQLLPGRRAGLPLLGPLPRAVSCRGRGIYHRAHQASASDLSKDLTHPRPPPAGPGPGGWSATAQWAASRLR